GCHRGSRLLVRSRKASAVTINGAGFDAGEGNPGSVIILQKRLGVGTPAVASSVDRGWPVCASSPVVFSVVSPPEQAEETARRVKNVKVLTRRQKSRPGEGESRSWSKGKEPATPLEEPKAPVGPEEGGASHR
ncbi:hypothetical protein B296_00035445, partial [Ensete ventricosum]